ncbi:10985_t:CDS:2, partial [Ambispora leptoticha]
KRDILDWAKKLSLAKQMADGIQYLHSSDIIHRGLHSKNILLHDEQIKISGFGLSEDIKSLLTSNARRFGAIPYHDPQIFIDFKYKKDKRSDIYSLGVLLWEISSCRVPFKDLNLLALAQEIQKGARETPLPDTPYEYMELYTHCWEYEPKDRPLIQEVCNRLESILIDLDYSPALADIADEFDDKLDSKLLAADL